MRSSIYDFLWGLPPVLALVDGQQTTQIFEENKNLLIGKKFDFVFGKKLEWCIKILPFMSPVFSGYRADCANGNDDDGDDDDDDDEL